MSKRLLQGTQQIATLGFDPGLRHGSIVYSVFESRDFDDDPGELVECKPIVVWKKKEGIGQRDEPSEIARFVDTTLIKPLHEFKGIPLTCATEWDPQSVYWRAQRLQIVTLSYMLGYFHRGLNQLGIPLIYISPHKLKMIFNISPKTTDKEYTQLNPQLVGYPEVEIEDSLRSNSDIYDAIMLSIFAMRIKHDYQNTIETLLSSQ